MELDHIQNDAKFALRTQLVDEKRLETFESKPLTGEKK